MRKAFRLRDVLPGEFEVIGLPRPHLEVGGRPIDEHPAPKLVRPLCLPGYAYVVNDVGGYFPAMGGYGGSYWFTVGHAQGGEMLGNKRVLTFPLACACRHGCVSYSGWDHEVACIALDRGIKTLFMRCASDLLREQRHSYSSYLQYRDLEGYGWDGEPPLEPPALCLEEGFTHVNFLNTQEPKDLVAQVARAVDVVHYRKLTEVQGV